LKLAKAYDVAICIFIPVLLLKLRQFHQLSTKYTILHILFSFIIYYITNELSELK